MKELWMMLMLAMPLQCLCDLPRTPCCERCFLENADNIGGVLAENRCASSIYCNACSSGKFRNLYTCQCNSCAVCPNGTNMTTPCSEMNNTVCSHSAPSLIRSKTMLLRAIEFTPMIFTYAVIHVYSK